MAEFVHFYLDPRIEKLIFNLYNETAVPLKLNS